ncbi:hypothetical protein JZ751_025853 [Albula glossodonta]|uniref:Ig-like domain-containing protein n=1 Tax=Albula glossodonta TaxID=121402 RepID=A0A8T2NDU1_9TELE|nr:hypothetical protein JZ751_025853 [Albula glossodonta]
MPPVTKTEAEQVSLECTYETQSTYVYIYWYRQYPGSALQYILYEGDASHTADFAKNRFRDSFQDEISAVANTVHAVEGNSVRPSCSYTASEIRSSYLHWYRQYPRSAPQFIILIHGSKDKEEKDGFTVKHDNQNKSVNLDLSSAKVTDSALYYCALQPTVTGNP